MSIDSNPLVQFLGSEEARNTLFAPQGRNLILLF